MRSIGVFLAVMVFLVGITPVWAHHGTNISYDNTKSITLKGTVTEFAWVNPHTQIYFDVKDEKGNIVHWAGEMNSPNLLHSRGLTRKSVKAGDAITITVSPSRSGAPVGVVTKLMLGDGQVLVGAGFGDRPQ